MDKFSASYNGINPNFVIQHNLEAKTIDRDLKALFYVTANIFNRGAKLSPSSFFIK